MFARIYMIVVCLATSPRGRFALQRYEKFDTTPTPPPIFPPKIYEIVYVHPHPALIRNSDFVEVTLARKYKEKSVFLLYFARLFVTLHPIKTRTAMKQRLI